MQGEKHKYPLKWYKQNLLKPTKHMAEKGKIGVKKGDFRV